MKKWLHILFGLSLLLLLSVDLNAAETIFDATEDAYLSSYNADSWQTAHDVECCDYSNWNLGYGRVGTWAAAARYYFRHVPLIFNTAGLGNNDIIDSAAVRIVTKNFIFGSESPHPIVHVVEGDFIEPYDCYDFEWGTRFNTTSGGSLSLYNNSPEDTVWVKLHSVGLAWINRSGETHLGLIDQFDLYNNSTYCDGRDANFEMYLEDNGSKVPQLKVWHRPPSPVYIYQPFWFDSSDATPVSNADSIDAWDSDYDSVCVHLDIKHFPNGWNAYDYWMAYTPMPQGVENPNIVKSDDGLGWEQPPGLSNPIDPTPSPGYNSDTDIFMDNATGDTMFCTYRQFVSGDSTLVMLRSCADGSTWTDPEDTILGDNDTVHVHLSPAWIHDGTNYRMYYVSGSTDVNRLWYRSTSHPRSAFNSPVQCTVHFDGLVDTLSNRELWHINIEKRGDTLFCLIVTCTKNTGGTGARLQFGRSEDMINFFAQDYYFMDLGSGGSWDDAMQYRSEMIWVADSAKYNLWYIGQDGSNWRMGHTEMSYRHDEVGVLHIYVNGTIKKIIGGN